MAAPVTTLFLDIGGVLLTNGWDRTMQRRAAQAFGLDCDEMSERHHLTSDTYENGKLSLDEYLDRIVFWTERPFGREAFKKFMFDQSQPYPQMIALMRALKERHRLKIAAVSNEGRELTTYRIKTFELGSFVDLFVASCFVHFRKPDPDIYRIALDIASVEPAEVVYVDDRPMFVEVARGLGIRSLHHESYDATRMALAALGLSAGD
jgi:putative hydrolase of the HAD superfamily